ncbi:hypothetical protein KPH14_005703 [Odynerus spinipes]|uniref:Tetratricopeptide SHNi-TPR domain-containing protein n=1 Tax=Odynerus spinipes TaxID=1348599 RepID=A0AAD9VIU4_9HYME|nr:hypothetical protein KPH14_005703 [Odynerus spinipes]
MADIADNVPFTDPATAITQGRRHLLVRDYTMAVTALAQACELLAKKHGDTADELGEAYLLYGRALLGLAREEAGVLGGGVPGSEEAQGEEDDEDEDEEDGEGEEEGLNKVDEEEDAEEEEEGDKKDEEVKKKEEKEEKEEKKEEKKKEENEKEEKKEEKKKATADGTSPRKQQDDDATAEKSKDVDDGKDKDKETGEKIKEDDKVEEAKADNGSEAKEKSAPESEAKTVISEASSSKQQNGDVQENGQQDTEDITKEDEEDEVNNLQVAWEVLELAKLVLLKRGPPGWKLLADSYRLLGEVAMEGGNHKGALNDLQGCLNLLEKIEPREPRAIAEIHYQLGLAHSLGNDFDASIEEFNKATLLLESRIKELEAITEPPKTDDPFYTVEGEIQELKDLLPEIQEKITDMKDFKQEACKLVIESIRSEIASGSSNGAGPSSSDTSSGGSSSAPKLPKPASDISHLVRKKRKADEPETDITVTPPCKKPTPEKAV